MSIKIEVWGKSPKGKDVRKFTMTNAMGASVSVIEWGAICTSIIVPDAGGRSLGQGGFDERVEGLGVAGVAKHERTRAHRPAQGVLHKRARGVLDTVGGKGEHGGKRIDGGGRMGPELPEVVGDYREVYGRPCVEGVRPGHPDARRIIAHLAQLDPHGHLRQ
jgi:hypothetical protein